MLAPQLFHWAIADDNSVILPFSLIYIALWLNSHGKGSLLPYGIFLVSKPVQRRVVTSSVEAPVSAKVFFKRVLVELVTQHKVNSVLLL